MKHLGPFHNLDSSVLLPVSWLVNSAGHFQRKKGTPMLSADFIRVDCLRRMIEIIPASLLRIIDEASTNYKNLFPFLLISARGRIPYNWVCETEPLSLCSPIISETYSLPSCTYWKSSCPFLFTLDIQWYMIMPTCLVEQYLFSRVCMVHWLSWQFSLDDLGYMWHFLFS